MAKSHTLSFTVPEDIKLKLEAIPKTGHYDSLSEFLRDAIRDSLSKNRHLRICIANSLYKENKISLGKAAEIIGENIEETKALFNHMELK